MPAISLAATARATTTPEFRAYDLEPGCVSVPADLIEDMCWLRGAEIAGYLRAIQRAREAGLSTQTIMALRAVFPKKVKFIAALRAHAESLLAPAQPEPATPVPDAAHCGSLQLFSADSEVV